MIETIKETVSDVLSDLLSLLPTSPLRPVIESLESVEWLGVINWFVPVGTLCTIAVAWGAAIGVFYIYQVVLRWVKVVDA